MNLPIELLVPTGRDEPIDWARLPRRAGVFALEDERGRTAGLSVTADLRRLVRARLEPAATESASRRIDYRSVTRRVVAVTVGSPFEADWVFLQQARQRLPAVYRSLLDRWQAWFVHCDPDEAFPRWQKTAHPGRPPTGPGGITVGPFPDKHAAGRYADLLEDAFDLCRYHHVLVQSPNGTACAYKEMERCPAPCDGSVTMEVYQGQIEASIAFATSPIDDWRAGLEVEIEAASDALQFEIAAALQRRLEATAPATRPAMRRAGPLEAFRFLAVMPGEHADTARLFRIRAGSIEPWADVACNASRDQVDDLIDALRDGPAAAAGDPETTVENIGLVCQYLFRPARRRDVGRLLLDPGEIDRRRLAAALRSVCDAARADTAITERSLDEAPPAS